MKLTYKLLNAVQSYCRLQKECHGCAFNVNDDDCYFSVMNVIVNDEATEPHFWDLRRYRHNNCPDYQDDCICTPDCTSFNREE